MKKTIGLFTAVVISTLALALAGGAAAEVFKVGNLELTIDGGFKPTALPKKEMAPISLTAEGHLRTDDGTTPPIVDRIVADFDKNGTIFTKGLAKCDPARLENQLTEVALKRCKKALVGRGETSAIVDFPDQDPFEARGPLLAFNGKPQGGNPVIIFHVFANVPAPTAFVVPSVISDSPKPGFRKRVTVNVPTIAGGNGTLTDFNVKIKRKWTDKKAKKKVKRFKKKIRKASGSKKRRLKKKLKKAKSQVKRSYLLARCRNERFVADFNVEYRTGTVIEGGIVRPCEQRKRKRRRHR